MKMIDVFSTKEPECLFCRESVRLFNNKMNSFETEYYCENCNEIFIPYERTQEFYFTVLNLGVFLMFKTKKMHIAKAYEDLLVLPPALPLVELDFRNKYKLVKKLKTYMTFS